MWKGTHPIAPDRRELSPQVTEGACGRCSCGLLMGWYLLIGIDAAPKGSLAKGSWHAGGVTEGFYSRHLFKVQTYVKRGRFFRE